MAIYKNRAQKVLDQILPFKNRRQEMLKCFLPYSYIADYLINVPKLKKWEEKNPTDKIVENRFRLYDYLNAEVLKNKDVTYLEFGVFEGATIKYWAQINKSLESKFIGFDTFTGLPEDWVASPLSTHDNKEYNANGMVPRVIDRRVSFVKGYFQQTLGEFLDKYRPASRLIIHSDSDLYSSTLFVLSKLDKHIVPGTVVIFDEFNSVLNEFKAFVDYSSAYMKKYKIICSTPNLVQVAIEFI